nr:1-acyl-sn-glycerol-3-phosphate acyltransferase [Bacteroidota bacterium]
MENQIAGDHKVEIGKDFINLKKVISDKNPRLIKLLPGFILSYLKRVIHQDELNAAIYKHRNKFGLDFIDSILNEFGVIIETAGLENLPRKGRMIIVSNHPLGGLDGMALMREVGKVRKDFLFPVNDLLMNLPNLKELFIPINKHGSNAENIRIFNRTFESDLLMLYFPAGLVSRKQKGQIIDLEWKKTVVSKAKGFKRDIIPVHIGGKNSNFFYNLANIRKSLGIKANIEMLYLVDEMFMQKDKIIKITFGNPIPYQVFDKRHTDREWAGILKEQVYALGRGEEKTIE